jgi:hypothetical protein
MLARTSTLALQDPLASLNRQIRSGQEWLPPGWYIAAYYWDVESGGIDLEARSQGQDWKQFAAAGIPPRRRHGRPAHRSQGPGPAFRRRGVRRHRAVRPRHLQRAETGKGTVRAGHPAIRHRRARQYRRHQRHHRTCPPGEQGVAEWLRLQIKEKAWKGLKEHSLAAWNIGPAPYGYVAERIPHPVPAKAAQGRSKTRLVPDPVRGPIVTLIYHWRAEQKLSVPAIAARLNADPDRYPAPGNQPGWTEQAIAPTAPA